jgi:hypothetical protein
MPSDRAGQLDFKASWWWFSGVTLVKLPIAAFFILYVGGAAWGSFEEPDESSKVAGCCLFLVALGLIYIQLGRLCNRTVLSVKSGSLYVNSLPFPIGKATRLPLRNILRVTGRAEENPSNTSRKVVYVLEAFTLSGEKICLAPALENIEQATYLATRLNDAAAASKVPAHSYPGWVRSEDSEQAHRSAVCR